MVLDPPWIWGVTDIYEPSGAGTGNQTPGCLKEQQELLTLANNFKLDFSSFNLDPNLCMFVYVDTCVLMSSYTWKICVYVGAAEHGSQRSTLGVIPQKATHIVF